MDLRIEVLRIAKAFDDERIPYAFCGAVSLAIHGYPRATKDIDILIAPHDLDAIRRVLTKLEYDLEAGTIPFDVGTDRERRIFRTSKAEGRMLITIDLLLAAGSWLDAWNARELFELDSQRICVVSREGLISMKKLAGRLQDLADIQVLEGGMHDR